MTPLATDAITILRCASNRRATEAGSPAARQYGADRRLRHRQVRGGNRTRGRRHRQTLLPCSTRSVATRFAFPSGPSRSRASTASGVVGCFTSTRTARCHRSVRCHGAGPSSTSTRCLVPTGSTLVMVRWRPPTAGRCCRTHWRRCSFWWGLSSSAGFKPGVRIKIAFWLDRACTGRELKRHLAGCPIDASTLRAVQPIFVARPILVNVADPIRQRSGFEEDIHDAVPVPELVAEAPPQERPALSPAGRRYVSGASQTVAERRLDALCGAIERSAVGGRHRCLIWAAARAVELDDALPREHIAMELITAARRAGLPDSDADLQRQVRNGFRLGIFGAEAAA